jgi:hypothetical protein
MVKFKKDQLRMMGVLTPWLQTNLPLIGESKTAQREAQDVLDGYPAILGKVGQTAVQTREVTKQRKALQKRFQTQILTFVGPLRLLAGRAKNIDLLGLVTIGRAAFRALRPEMQVGVGKKIMEAAAAHAMDLAENGLTSDHLKDANAALDEFTTALPNTQSLLDVRKNANATYEEVHAAMMQQIYELDLAMAVFQTLNPGLYKEYKTARAILDTGRAGAADTPQ